MGSALREIIAKFGIEVDTKELHEAGEGVEGMIEKLKKFAGAAAAAFMVKEVFEFATSMAEAAIEVEHSAAAFGLSTKEMQEWQLAAKISGVEVSTLDTSFKMLAKNVGKGVGPGVDALAKLGVKVKDASGQVRPMSALFEDAGDAIGKIENAGKRAAIGQEVFGRQFIKILPLITKGRDGMAELRGELEKLGGGFDEAFIEKSKEVEGQSARLGQVWTSLKVNLAAFLLPAVVWLTTKAITLVGVLISAVKTTESLKAAAVMLGVAGLAALSALIGPLGAAFGMLATTVLPLIAAFVLIEDFFTFLSGGDSLIGRAIEGAFGPGAAEKVRAWFLNVGKGLGDIGADFEDLKLGAKILWNAFLNSGLYAAASLSDGFTKLWNMIKHGALFSAASLSDAFDNAWDLVIDGAKKAIGFIGRIPGMKDIGKDLDLLDHAKKKGHAVADLQAGPQDQAGTAVDDLKAIMAREDQAFVQKYDQIHNVQTTGGDTHTTVTVHVAPGTPEQQARAVGEAAAKGAHKGAQTARGTHAALVPGRG